MILSIGFLLDEQHRKRVGMRCVLVPRFKLVSVAGWTSIPLCLCPTHQLAALTSARPRCLTQGKSAGSLFAVQTRGGTPRIFFSLAYCLPACWPTRREPIVLFVYKTAQGSLAFMDILVRARHAHQRAEHRRKTPWLMRHWMISIGSPILKELRGSLQVRNL